MSTNSFFVHVEDIRPLRPRTPDERTNPKSEVFLVGEGIHLRYQTTTPPQPDAQGSVTIEL